MSMQAIDGKEVTRVTTTPEYGIGEYRVANDGKMYRYMKRNDATVAVTNGSVVGLVTPATLSDGVTADISDTVANLVAGVAVATVADGSYAWFQVRGYHSAVKTNGDDDIAAGVSLIWGTDGVVDSVAAGTATTYKLVGISTAADVDASDTVAAELCIA